MLNFRIFLVLIILLKGCSIGGSTPTATKTPTQGDQSIVVNINGTGYILTAGDPATSDAYIPLSSPYRICADAQTGDIKLTINDDRKNTVNLAVGKCREISLPAEYKAYVDIAPYMP